jgi:hypothetical protein
MRGLHVENAQVCKNSKRPKSKSPRSTTAGFFNSPFGLWLLSAVVLTVGSAALSARHDCLVSARSDIESYNRVTDELLGRRLRLFNGIAFALITDDFGKAVRSNDYATFKEFDGQGIRSLVAQQRRILARFDLRKSTSEYFYSIYP